MDKYTQNTAAPCFLLGLSFLGAIWETKTDVAANSAAGEEEAEEGRVQVTATGLEQMQNSRSGLKKRLLRRQ